MHLSTFVTILGALGIVVNTTIAVANYRRSGDIKVVVNGRLTKAIERNQQLAEVIEHTPGIELPPHPHD
jgi:hypothetical protein